MNNLSHRDRGAPFHHGRFIPSIEGMRALAVLAVLLFHVELSLVGSGYLGVDLFFVISGFIITRNILNDDSAGAFSLREFYIRRFRRLFPALLVTVLVTLLCAIVLVPPLEQTNIAVSSLYAIFSLANFHFWSEAGYFDAAAHTKPLLHTWSLSVEEQFYLFWPVLLTLAATIKRRASLAVILLLLSLVATIVLRRDIPDSIFYLLPFRVHQLMAGALLAVFVVRLSGLLSELATVLGTVGLLALFSMTDDVLSPAIGATWVTALGALLLLSRESRCAGLLFANPPMQWIGQRSYAIYLVHWPLIVLYLYATDFHIAKREMLGLFVVSLVLAVLLHELVEKPFRKRGPDTTLFQRTALPASLFGIVLTVGVAVTTLQMDGLIFRENSPVQSMIAGVPLESTLRKSSVRYGKCNLHEEHSIADYDTRACATPVPGKVNVLVIGDSMAADIYAVLAQAYPEINFLQATAGSCSPYKVGEKALNSYRTCFALNELRFGELALQDVDLVVMAGFWSRGRLQDFAQSVDYLHAAGKRVLVFGPRAMYRGGVPTLLGKETSLEGLNSRLARHVVRREELLDEMRRIAPEVHIVDMYPIQCDPECIAVEKDKLLYIDGYHFTRLGARRMGERFREQFDLVSFLELD